MARQRQSFEEQLAMFLQTATKDRAEAILLFAAGIVKARFPTEVRTRKAKENPTEQPRLMA